jgi:hypothetical protein
MAVNIAVFGAFVLIVAVLGFFLWQTLFASEEYGYGEKKSEPAYSEQQTSSEYPPRSSAPPSHRNATDEAIAEYTKWLAIFTLFLVLATIGLFVSGERNVEVARKTASAAKESADATRDSVKLAENTTQRQLRAYVSIIDAFIKLVDDDAAIETTIFLKNSGQTPGYKFRTTTRVEIGAPPTKGSPYTDLIPAQSRSIIGPGAIHNIGPIKIVFGPGELQAIRNGSRTIFVWGRADYVDAFGVERHFIFRALNGRELVNTDVATGRVNWRGWAVMPSPEGYEAN